MERKQFDPLPLLGALTAQRVEFVIVGGLAGNLHGSARVTYDLDVAYARDVENLERLAAMLSSVHATLRGAPEDLPFLLDAKTLAAGSNFTFATDFGPLDVLGDPAGAPPYSELAAEAEHLDLAGLEVAVASLDHLIRMKEAAGRPQDKLDTSEYRALWEEIRAREGR